MLLTIVWFILFIFCAYSIYDCIKPANFPPGPRWLPFIGCFLTFRRLKLKHGYIHLAFQELTKMYGPILGLKLGKQKIVIISNYDLVKKVLLREEFNGRPDGFFFRVRSFGERKGVLFTEGSTWSQHKKFSMRHLRAFGFGQSTMKDYLTNEAQNLIQHLHDQSKRGPVPMHTAFNVAVINSLWTMFAGHRFDYEDKKMKEILQVVHDAFRLMDTLGGVMSYMPLLRFIIPELCGYNKMMSILKKLWAFIDEEIKIHERVLSKDEPRDLIDAFLIEISRNKEPDTIFNREDLMILCLDLFLAGSETTSNTLAMTFIHLALNLKWMKILQQELDTVVGRNRPPSIADRSLLPTVEAFLAEVQRTLILAPLGVPHKAMKDVILEGYRIPKDTTVMVDIQSVHNDKNYYDDPNEFRPQRFLNAEGQFCQKETVIPFGLGKRRCLGEGLARSSLFLFFTYVIHYFNFEISSEHGPPDPNGYDGFTISPKPYYLKLSFRSDVKN